MLPSTARITLLSHLDPILHVSQYSEDYTIISPGPNPTCFPVQRGLHYYLTGTQSYMFPSTARITLLSHLDPILHVTQYSEDYTIISPGPNPTCFPVQRGLHYYLTWTQSYMFPSTARITLLSHLDPILHVSQYSEDYTIISPGPNPTCFPVQRGLHYYLTGTQSYMFPSAARITLLSHLDPILHVSQYSEDYPSSFTIIISSNEVFGHIMVLASPPRPPVDPDDVNALTRKIFNESLSKFI